ncbi:MAG: hypothetical protein PXX73_06060 [Sideroxydans sp.]|nr:hypothetical protein [Sideroxydans sp.]
MEIQTEYQHKKAAQLKEWGAQINLLEAKIENMGTTLKVERIQQLKALRATEHAAAEKMKELGKASGEAWEQLKVTADKVWDELKAGVAEAHAKFK